MRAIHSPAKGGAWVLTALLVATACQPDLKPDSPGLERQIRENSLTAERDSLLLEVAANGRLLTDIQTTFDQVAPVSVRAGQPETAGYESGKEQRQVALDRAREIIGRLKTVEARLAVTERKVRKLTGARDSLARGLTDAEASLATLAALVETQKGTVASLTSQLDQMLVQNEILSDSLYHLADARNTAYYVVGTRKELLAKGVLVEDGHRAIPLVGRRSVQPARKLPLSEFTSIDRDAIRDLPLPDSTREYRIVSRQNLAHLASIQEDGRVQGSISIASPEEFWEGSRYLIVVEQ